MIKVSGLNKYFNRHKKNEIHVIDNTSLEFDDTGLVCILGESGSGKTTLLNAIGGLDDFSDGSITVDDVTLNKYVGRDFERLRNRKYGYIFQNYYLLMDATVEYNIRVALDIFDMTDEEAAQRIDYVLEAVDMYKFKNRLISELSGGQQQRIAIARALAKAPDIIFADEPTGNLDENNTMRIMSIIKKISSKCLVILVTHELRIAEFFADRIIEIKDGRVASDRINTKNGSYTKSDDPNIYLGELQHEKMDLKMCEANIFTDKSNADAKITMALVDGKLYIKGNQNVVYITPDSETDLIDAKKPEYEIDDIENFSYELESVKLKKKPSLPMRTLWRLAKNNVRNLGKKQIFLFVALIAMAVMITISVSDYYASKKINNTDFITEDSHHVNISATSKYSKTTSDIIDIDNENGSSKILGKIYEEFEKSGIDGELVVEPEAMLVLNSDKFDQYRNYKYNTSKIAYVSFDKLSESDLIYGRMPENSREVVLDKKIVERFQGNKSIVGAMIKDYDDVCEFKLSVGFKYADASIVGICDTGEVTVYMSQEAMINAGSLYNVKTLEELKQTYPGEYDDYELEEGCALISQYYYDGYITDDISYRWKDMYDFDVVEDMTFPEEFAEVVINADDIHRYIRNKSLFASQIKIYSDEPEKVKEFFDEKFEEYIKYVDWEIKYTYGDEVSDYFESKKVSTRTKIIVTILVIIMAFSTIFFMMKTNAINRTGELVVYRLIGISPLSIVKSYIMELLLIVTITQLPAVVLTAGLLKYLSVAGILSVAIGCPLYVLIGMIVICYVADIIIGILPVYKIVKLPPAKLAARN